MAWDPERFAPGAYREGREHARTGRKAKLDDCPYAGNFIPAQAWRRGFEAERAAVERRREIERARQ